MTFSRYIHLMITKWSWKLYLCDRNRQSSLYLHREMLKIQLESTQATWFKPEIGSDFKVDPDLWRGLEQMNPSSQSLSQKLFCDQICDSMIEIEKKNPVSHSENWYFSALIWRQHNLIGFFLREFQCVVKATKPLKIAFGRADFSCLSFQRVFSLGLKSSHGFLPQPS